MTSLGTSSFEQLRKQKEDAKKKQSGELAPDVDIESGKIINPHNPEFITKVPWYLGNNNGPTLTHHNVQKTDHYLTLNETEQLIEIKTQFSKQHKQAEGTVQVFQKGACKNCGSLTHKEKDCIERPRSSKKAAWKTGVAIASGPINDVALKLEEHGKVSYDAKRDYWKGYDPKQYNEVIENFELIENERRKMILQEKELKRKEREEMKGAVRKTKGKKVKDKANLSESDENNDKTTDSSSDSDSDSDAESDVDSDNEDVDNIDLKTDFINRDEKAVDFQYQFGRQGGVGGNEFKLTSRNLRIREDTPKYLRNLALNSAFYDPKSRSMRANPYPDANPEDVPYAGDNFLRQSGDALKLASTQVLCWEMQGNKGEDGQVIDVISNPSQAEWLQREYLEKKKQLNESKKRAILEKYANVSADASESEIPGMKELDVRLRLGQTEAYVEYSRDGRIVKGPGSGVVKVSKTSKYEEDVYINNHTSVWGSYYHRGQGAWGFACCHSLVKNSYCVGSKGIEANDIAASSATTGVMDQKQAIKMLETVNNPNDSKKSNKTMPKRSDIYGESSLDATTQLDQEKVKNAIESFKKEEKDRESKMNDDVVVGKKRGGYNSMKGVDVTLEDMEAYRMSKIRRDDPMAKFIEEE